jgi:hypothetical protein
MWYKNRLPLLLLLIGGLINSSMATNYSLPPGFISELEEDDINLSLPTIMLPSAIIASLNPKSEKITVQAFKLELKSYSDNYRIGETISFSIRSEQDCYLTVINKGTTGKTTVLFPNAFHPNNYIKANAMLLLPSESLMPVDALYIGRPDNSITKHETIIAICRQSEKPLFQQPYQFDDYNFRTFSSSEDWSDQTRTVDDNQEARSKVRFTAKAALIK